MKQNSQTEAVKVYDNAIGMPNRRETPSPFLFRFDGVYYLYMTTWQGKISCYESDDMVHFRKADNHVLEEGYCYDVRKDSHVPERYDCFLSPSVCYLDGDFLLSVNLFDGTHLILKATSPNGPFHLVYEKQDGIKEANFHHGKDDRTYFVLSGEESALIVPTDNGIPNLSVPTPLPECHIAKGGNRFPFLFERYGVDYVTYSGTDPESRHFRVDYASSVETDNLLLQRDFFRQETLLVSTTDQYHGLGHASVVLGPDLDSYFLCYQNKEEGPTFFNVARLSFDQGRLLLSGDRRKDNPMVESAKRVPYPKDQADTFIRLGETSDCFTVEFNNVGEGKMMLSYTDENHYVSLSFSENVITVLKKEAEKESVLVSVPLRHLYRHDVLHTYRFQYHQGRFALYFDGIEKEVGNITIPNGEIGYLRNHGFLSVHDTFISSFAMGSSEETYPHTKAVFADGYDRSRSLTEGRIDGKYLFLDRGDKASYHFYLNEDSDYQVILSVPSLCFGKRVLISVDDVSCFAEIPEIPNLNEARTEVLTLNLKKGLHTVVIRGLVYFSELELNPVPFSSYLSIPLRDGADFTFFRFRNSLNLTKQGMESQNQNIMSILMSEIYVDCKVDTEVTYRGSEQDGCFGILLSVRNAAIPSADDPVGKDDPDSYQGVFFGMTSHSVFIRKVDYHFTETLAEAPFTLQEGESYHLAAYQSGNRLSFVVDGKEILDVYCADVSLSGAVGLTASSIDVVFRSIAIHPQH